MMTQLMKECCGQGGMPDFEKMKSFMETDTLPPYAPAALSWAREVLSAIIRQCRLGTIADCRIIEALGPR